MTGKTEGAKSANYYYIYGDKLQMSLSNFPGEHSWTTYQYDGLGRRRNQGLYQGGTTWFRWQGMEESGEYASAGSWTIGALQTGYVPGLASFAGSDPATAEWRYQLTDHLGSVRHLTGQNKAFLARYDYAPYGELMRHAGLPLTVGYTGHHWDAAIGQYFAPFRYYNPQTARWNMRDPLGFVDGPNVYAYVAGNPVNYIDPDGLQSCPPPNPTKPFTVNGYRIGPVHPAVRGANAHRHIQGRGVNIRFDSNGIVVKGPNAGKPLSALREMRSVARRLVRLGLIINRALSIPFIIISPIFEIRIPSPSQTCYPA